MLNIRSNENKKRVNRPFFVLLCCFVMLFCFNKTRNTDYSSIIKFLDCALAFFPLVPSSSSTSMSNPSSS